MSAEVTNQQPVPLVNVQIDGVWHQFPKGTRIIEACSQVGKFIPRYCYHPRLTSPGNCRMCMVQLGMPKMGPDRKPELDPDGKPVHNWVPRTNISCAQDVSEGLSVRTDSDVVKEARKAVLEFLLINHPLDCPICDQAGECRLQEFSVDYGQANSRFLEEKVKKPKHVEIGPRVTYDGERCILCTRCIRFMREVAKDDVLGIVNRGGQNYIACHPNRALDSNYSLNTVDLCPVGALTSTDFRFKMRTWFLKETKSICTSCATGCNTVIGARENIVYRQTPRENNDVNQTWMCDHGRLDFHDLASPERLLSPLVRGADEPDWNAAFASIASAFKLVAPGQTALVASGKLTNEEQYLAARLVEALGITLHDIVPHQDKGDGILLSADRNPNTAGAQLLGVSAATPGAALPAITGGVRGGAIKALIILGEDATQIGLTEADLKKLEVLVVTSLLPNATTAAATHVLPACGFAEKRGSMLNKAGRLQRLNQAVQAPGLARADWEILAGLQEALTGKPAGFTGIDDVFQALAAAIPAFAGLSLGKIGDLGVQLQPAS
ncbi:MAG: molybdopterin-dependent oxidoreductase [Chthoniobacteraceae bacterium]|nr:molybdopterin-dependent oxidoreductase [Chthoniobacteraceae bacterium]